MDYGYGYGYGHGHGHRFLYFCPTIPISPTGDLTIYTIYHMFFGDWPGGVVPGIYVCMYTIWIGLELGRRVGRR